MKRPPPVGRLRGKTRAGRLALWDALMQQLWPEAVTRGVVEVGLGDRADTAVELAEALPASVPLWVVEVHPARAASGRSVVEAAGGQVVVADALVGPPLNALPQAGLVRCANVLRQYPPASVPRAHQGLLGWADSAGVVLEGSCDAGGDIGSFHVLTAGGTRSALVFFSTFARGFAPMQMRDWLPRDLRREVRKDGVLSAFFDQWMAAWKRTRLGRPHRDFAHAAEAMDMEWVDLDVVRAGASACIWRPAGGVPRPL